MMKIREVIPQMTTIDEGRGLGYYSILADKQRDRDRRSEEEWVEQGWADLMNKKQQAMLLKKL